MRRRALYIWVLFFIPAASTFGHYLAPNEPLVKGHDLGIVTAWILAGVAGLLWLPYRRDFLWPRYVLIFLGIVGVAWVYQIIRTQADGSLFNLTAFVVPFVLAMIATKAVSARDLKIAVLALAYSLLTIALLSLLFGSFGLLPDGFAVSDGGGNRLQTLFDLGLTRWGGPFGSVNYAAPVGGLLVVMGLAFNRGVGLPLTAGGIVILALSQGRTALFATIAATIILFLWSARVRRMRKAVAIRIGVLASFAVMTIAYILIVDPTLAYRTYLWSDYATLFDDSPLVGVGDSGVNALISGTQGSNPVLPIIHNHAHSVLLDAYVRFGLVLVLLGLAMYAMAIYRTFTSIRRIGSGPLALVVYVIVAGLAETIYSWNYWSVYLAVLVWSVLITAARPLLSEETKARHASLSLVRDGT